MASWRIFSPFRNQKSLSRTAQGSRARGRNGLRQRNLRYKPLELLEERRLLTVGGRPDLIAIIPNEGAIIDSSNPTLHIAPKDLTIRFDDGQSIDPTTLGGIQIVRGGPDKTLGTSDDVSVTTGFVGIGDNSNEVIV